MIKPHGSERSIRCFVYDTAAHARAARRKPKALPSLLVNSAAAANAVMLGERLLQPAAPAT